MRRSGDDAGFIKQVEMLRAAPRAREAMYCLKPAFFDQRRLEGTADPTGRSHDNGGGAHACDINRG